MCTQHLQHLHSSLQVGHIVYTKPLLALSFFASLTLPSCLFILYKIDLNMGKPMGRHPFPITLTQNPKRAPKVGRDPMISASPGAPSLIGCRCPKTVKYDQVFLKTWSRANRPPTLTYDSSRVTLVWSTFLRMSRSWPELLRAIAVWQPLA